jgi:uncharacterized paraquat-inducible protein A
MTRSPARDVPIDEAAKHEPKFRQCLRCQATFHSEWIGERICSRCKGTTTWRNGTSLRTFASSNRH